MGSAKAVIRKLGWEAWCEGCDDGSGAVLNREEAAAWKKLHDEQGCPGPGGKKA